MKRILIYTILSTFLFSSALRADEGMWLPILIQQYNLANMQKLGCKLSAEDIYSINKACIKDAVVSLDHGSCTGEIISGEGLLLTNHHCGYREIQDHSSVTHDYLEDGFWAMKRSDELVNPSKTVSFLVRMEEITAKVLEGLKDGMKAYEREEAINQAIEKIKTDAIGDTHYEASVESMFENNSYYLFIYETFKDVRLVGAPPSSIGKFGGDTDNWMWPRHTGDFSVFRVYSAPDGSPAEYSPENIPLKPKYFLPISLKGIKKDDFAMILGYPGSTHRYFTSWAVENEMKNVNDVRVKVRTKKLDLMKEDMQKSKEVKIQYASKYSESSNYWKYSIGQNLGLKNLDVIYKKQQIENEFKQWIDADATRKAKYANVLQTIKQSYADASMDYKAQNYWFEAIYQGMEIMPFAIKARKLQAAFKNSPEDAAALEQAANEFKEAGDEFFKDYNQATDLKISTAMLDMYRKDLPAEYLAETYKEIDSLYSKNIESYLKNVLSNSIFTNKTLFDKFVQTPNNESVLFTTRVLMFPYYHNELVSLLKNSPKEKGKLNQYIKQLKEIVPLYFKNYDKEKEKNQFVERFSGFYSSVPKERRPAIFKLIDSKYKGDIKKFAEAIFAKSIFTDSVKYAKFISKPSYKTLEKDLAFKTMQSLDEESKITTLLKDPGYALMQDFLQIYFKILSSVEKKEAGKAEADKLWSAGYREMKASQNHYPDANSTMRMTYGVVGDYKTKDAIQMNYFTTIDGYIQKEDSTNEDFIVPKRLKELFYKKDFGKYAENGTVTTCFTTNNDITGGNSGSPVMNANGELIGAAFDGNWEAMSGDIAYESQIQKTIVVDIRFVLWVMDKYAGAGYLLKEMKLVE